MLLSFVFMQWNKLAADLHSYTPLKMYFVKLTWDHYGGGRGHYLNQVKKEKKNMFPLCGFTKGRTQPTKPPSLTYVTNKRLAL